MNNRASAKIFVLGSFVVACSAKVTRFPLPGETLEATGFVTDPGGKGFNLAVGARRLGADISGVFAIGQDIFADFAEQAFVRAGLPTSMLVRRNAPTACGVGFTNLLGENCIAVFPGANAEMTAEDVATRHREVCAADLVMAQFESPDEPIRAGFRIAREAGRATLLNPSPCRDLPSGLLAHTSILIMNETEANHLAGRKLASDEPSPSAGSAQDLAALAGSLMRQGPGLVVITLGSGGAFAYSRDQAPLYQPAFPVDVCDSIGCGDAFTAGFATAVAAGQSLRDSMRAAAGSGAIVARRHGVFEALPDRMELEAFLHGAI